MSIKTKFQKTVSPNIWTKTMWVNIAAMFIAVIGTYLFLINYNKPVDTFKDPAIAYAESVKIFTEVSEKLNIGISAIEEIPKANYIATKSIGHVDQSVSDIISSLDNIGNLGKTIGSN